MNRDRLRRALALLRNPAGLRAQLLSEFRYLLTPLACFAASAYRRWWVAECRVIVVFGSFGKTTTAHFAAHALACVGSGRVAVNTLTPVALAVLRLRRDSRTAVFEVGIGDRGQMAKFARMLRPDIAVATSIGSEHQEKLGGLAEIRAEKAIMVEALGPDGLAVLNGDDANVAWMRTRTRARVVRCGAAPGNDIRATRVALHFPPRTHLRIESGDLGIDLTTRLIGPAAVFPVLAAFALAREIGVSWEAVAARLRDLAPFNRRMASVPLASGAWGIVDDGKAVPETIATALQTLSELPAKRKWIVMGEIGLPDAANDVAGAYREWGARLGRACDELVLTTADPEKRRHFLEGALSAGLDPARVLTTDGSLRAALAHLREHTRAGDAVLFKGRFHERLTRVALALAGTDVTCWIPRCEPRLLECRRCPQLTAPPRE